MIIVLVKAANTFGIDYNDVHLLALLCVAHNRLTPHPDSFGAGINGWPHSKAIFLDIKEYAVEEVALTCAVHPSDGDDADRTLDQGEYFLGFIGHFKLLVRIIPCHQREGLLNEAHI